MTLVPRTDQFSLRERKKEMAETISFQIKHLIFGEKGWVIYHACPGEAIGKIQEIIGNRLWTKDLRDGRLRHYNFSY